MNLPKHEQALANRLYRSEKSETGRRSVDRRELMVLLWQRMADYFPQWEDRYGTVNNSTISAWQDGLERYSQDDIAGAMKAVRDEWVSKGFPPDFPQFRALVMAARSKANPPEVQKYLQPPDTNPINDEGFKRMKREQAAVAQMSTDRDEEFVRAYYAAGLHVRWGRLDREQERKYLST